MKEGIMMLGEKQARGVRYVIVLCHDEVGV